MSKGLNDLLKTEEERNKDIISDFAKDLLFQIEGLLEEYDKQELVDLIIK
ncbi:hypothetical protein [Alkalihalophilus marmarensis]|uniref:Uncharacterized protein n=1 Tax=Alkalihalophilus marmarensis DSM 21297 TaxID=1188261 RepID=U6SIR4_9BACI|nr:hypothetical protein [Alkalihalophilus marmarensis]ERN51619.1 hypothetical protein A33I_20005 [Alkalihalophilus marmarensis DSM 21297]